MEQLSDLELRLLDGKTDFTEYELCDLAFEYSFQDEEHGARRWYEGITSYIKVENRYFALDWDRGLTENQEHQFDNQPYEVERKEEQVTVTKVTYNKL